MRIGVARRRRRAAPVAVALFLSVVAPALCLRGPAAEERTVVILQTSAYSAYTLATQSIRSALETALPDVHLVAVVLPDQGEEAAAREALSQDCALIVAIGTRAARLARAEARGRPLIYAMVLDPGEIGLPGPGELPRGNATGVAMAVAPLSEFGLMRDIMPAIRRVGVLYDPLISGGAVRRAAAAAASAGIRLISQPVRSSAEVLDAARLLAPNVDAVLAVADPTVLTPATTREFILFWLRSRKPLFGLSEGFVRDGALAALVADPVEVGRSAGEIAVRVLRGTPISAIPPLPPPRLQTFLNRASSEHLGIKLPEALIAQSQRTFPEP